LGEAGMEYREGVCDGIDLEKRVQFFPAGRAAGRRPRVLPWVGCVAIRDLSDGLKENLLV